jgi:hypothetical protein
VISNSRLRPTPLGVKENKGSKACD